MPSLSYEHIFHPASPVANPLPPPPLLLLHGTGGTEHDLVPLARRLSPGSALLAPRGDVNEHGQLRFFRRFAEGVFDLDDVRRRTLALADFITAAVNHYDIDASRLLALGFSNGANIAATLLQLRPASLAGAVLLRPMVVLDQPAAPGSLSGKPIFIAAGTHDPIVPPASPLHLAALLRSGGATVATHAHEAGHGLIAADFTAAHAFLTQRPEPR